MKKLWCIFLAAILSMTMMACSSGNGAESVTTGSSSESSQAISSSEPSVESESVEPKLESLEPMTSESLGSSFHTASTLRSTFGFTTPGLVEVLSSTFTKTPDMPNAFASEPTIEEDQDALLGNTVSYTYEIVPGASCTIYSIKETDEVYSVLVYIDFAKLTSDNARIVGGYLAVLSGKFEPDSETLAQIDAELDIANATEDTVNIAFGTIANYTYIIDGTQRMLLIDAK